MGVLEASGRFGDSQHVKLDSSLLERFLGMRCKSRNIPRLVRKCETLPKCPTLEGPTLHGRCVPTCDVQGDLGNSDMPCDAFW